MGSHLLLQGILLTQGWIKSRSPALKVDPLPSEPPGKPRMKGSLRDDDGGLDDLLGDLSDGIDSDDLDLD